MIILVLSILAAPASAAPTCKEVQEGLLAKAFLWWAPTYTGRCRSDMAFVNAPRPYDAERTIEDQRVVIDLCVREQKVDRYMANIRFNAGKIGAADPVEIVSTSLGEKWSNDGHSASWARPTWPDPFDSRQGPAKCIRMALLGPIQLPAQPNALSTVTYHYTYPPDLDALLGLDGLTTPLILPGVGSEIDP